MATPLLPDPGIDEHDDDWTGDLPGASAQYMPDGYNAWGDEDPPDDDAGADED